MTPTPEEPPEEGPERDDSGSFPDGTGAALRGWIDPDDRLWRHPSELARTGIRTAQDQRSGARHPRTMILIGAAATLAAVAWAVVLLSPASDHPPSTPTSANTTDATLAVRSEAVPVSADAAGHSMVQLQAVTSHGTTTVVGVAVAEGGLVATTADALSGLRSLSMIGTNGRRLRASVVGIDTSSDIALVSVPQDIPVAPFADDVALSTGSADMILTMAAPVGNIMSLHCQDGTLTGIDTVIASGTAKGMPALTSAPAANLQAGDPLLNQEGQVIGLLYSSAPSPTFLPTQLVLGVADDLRSTGHVAPGWLGVQGATAADTGGAEVAALMAGSPATGILHSGDVVVAIGTVPVRSMADLRARLYVLPPYATVGLSVIDGSTTRVVDVTLSPSP